MFLLFVALVLSINVVNADIIAGINNFFNPASLDPKIMIQIGELISKNEWESHARKLLESIPFFEEYVWKLQIPFKFAAPYLCEPCREYAPQVQTFLKNTGMASLAFDLAVCNIFFVFEKHDMVPVCDAALVGLDIYARYADPQILCSAIPSCQPSLKSVKRSASINDIAERFLRTF